MYYSPMMVDIDDNDDRPFMSFLLLMVNHLYHSVGQESFASISTYGTRVAHGILT
jgi:hypothetical protein